MIFVKKIENGKEDLLLLSLRWRKRSNDVTSLKNCNREKSHSYSVAHNMQVTAKQLFLDIKIR